MKKIVIAGELGHVVVASYKEDNKISLVSMKPMFKLGEKTSTIPNVMNALASTLARIAETEEQVTIALRNDIVAEKINSDILVREFWDKKTLANSRPLSAPELSVYGELIKGVGATYGQVRVMSTQYVTKAVRDGLTQDQLEWANLYTACNASLKSKVAPAPQLAEEPALDGEPSDEDVAI